MHDNVLSFKTNFYRLWLCKDIEPGPMTRLIPPFIRQGCINNLELLTCAWFPNPPGLLSFLARATTLAAETSYTDQSEQLDMQKVMGEEWEWQFILN